MTNNTAVLDTAALNPVGVGVKPLEWHEWSTIKHDYGRGLVEANTAFSSNYSIADCSDVMGRMGFEMQWYVRKLSASFATLDEAKTACQADYETRIRSALAPVTVGRDMVEALREALRAAEDTLRLVERPAFRDPKHGDEVEALGLRIGFGALMASASSSWRAHLAADGDPGGGEFVAGPCHGTVISTLAKIRAALAGTHGEVALGEDEMPERIWAGDFDAQGFGHCVAGMQGGLYAEYVRADLAHPPKPAIDAGALVERVYQSVVSCPHTIDADSVVLRFDHKAEGHNALNQIYRRLTAALLEGAAAGSGAVAEETAWLIELKGSSPRWWSLTVRPDPDWTPDASKALRFSRKEDAAAYISDLGWTEAFASEHMWQGRRVHDWFEFKGMKCCRTCGNVWNDTSDTRSCKGPVKVGPRTLPAAPETEQRNEKDTPK